MQKKGERKKETSAKKRRVPAAPRRTSRRGEEKGRKVEEPRGREGEKNTFARPAVSLSPWPRLWKCRCSTVAFHPAFPHLLLRYHRRRIWQEYAIISASSIWWRLLSIHHTCRFLRRIYLDAFPSRSKLSCLFAHGHRRAGLNVQIVSKILVVKIYHCHSRRPNALLWEVLYSAQRSCFSQTVWCYVAMSSSNSGVAIINTVTDSMRKTGQTCD